MARLESQKKMGYYPTPIEVVEEIAKKLTTDRNSDQVTILDPCCGDGTALATIKEMCKNRFKPILYGVELDGNRYKKAKKKLDYVLKADALNEVVLPDKSISLLFLNPPYDTSVASSEDDKADRIEVEFLRKYTPSLIESGGLIYIIPVTSLKYAYTYLRKNYHSLSVEPFPEDLYKKFKQVVVYAKRNVGRRYVDHDRLREMIDILNSIDPNDYDDVREKCNQVEYGYTFVDYSSIYDEESDYRFFIYPSAPLLTFKKATVTPRELYKSVSSVSSETVREIYKLYKEKYDTNGSKLVPLINLKKGHLAILIATGYLNGTLEKDGKRYTVKGIVRKGESKETSTEIKNGTSYEVTTRKTRFDVHINVYDYQKNDFYTVKQ